MKRRVLFVFIAYIALVLAIARTVPGIVISLAVGSTLFLLTSWSLANHGLIRAKNEAKLGELDYGEIE